MKKYKKFKEKEVCWGLLTFYHLNPAGSANSKIKRKIIQWWKFIYNYYQYSYLNSKFNP